MSRKMCVWCGWHQCGEKLSSFSRVTDGVKLVRPSYLAGHTKSSNAMCGCNERDGDCASAYGSAQADTLFVVLRTNLGVEGWRFLTHGTSRPVYVIVVPHTVDATVCDSATLSLTPNRLGLEFFCV